jgi:hypothetical protein
MKTNLHLNHKQHLWLKPRMAYKYMLQHLHMIFSLKNHKLNPNLIYVHDHIHQVKYLQANLLRKIIIKIFEIKL